MSTFDAVMDFIIGVETDQLTDNAGDPGGLTKYGISKVFHPNVDVANLTRDGALNIYQTEYWIPCCCASLPAPLAMVVMDTAVNQSVRMAIMLLQLAIGVDADCLIGPKTLAAARTVPVERSVPEYAARRAVLYATSPVWDADGLGFSRRNINCLLAALALK